MERLAGWRGPFLLALGGIPGLFVPTISISRFPVRVNEFAFRMGRQLFSAIGESRDE
jgi:hypothetical protein